MTLIIFIPAAITDYIDGEWARYSGQVTNLGKFLDPLADKMLVDGVLISFCFMGRLPSIILYIIIARDLAVDGIRMNAAIQEKVIDASNLGRAKTMTQMIALTLLLVYRILLFETQGVLSVISCLAAGCGTILFIASFVLVVMSG